MTVFRVNVDRDEAEIIQKDAKAAPGLVDAWKQIKAKHKELANTKMFTPDVTPLFVKYDSSVDSMAKSADELHKADTVADNFADQILTLRDKLDGHEAEIDKLRSQSGAVMDKFVREHERTFALKQVGTDIESLAKLRKAANDRIDQIMQDQLKLAKTGTAQAKSKEDAAWVLLKKLNTDGLHLVEQIKKVLGAYQKAAIKMDADAVADDIGTLFDKLQVK